MNKTTLTALTLAVFLSGCGGLGMKMDVDRYPVAEGAGSAEDAAPQIPGVAIAAITPRLIAQLRAMDTARSPATPGGAAVTAKAEPTPLAASPTRMARIHVARVNANVRARPSLQSVKLGLIAKGRAAIVGDTASHPGWHALQWQGQTGYVSAELVEARDIPAQSLYLALENARVRSGPSMNDTQLGTIVRGGAVIVRGQASRAGWLEVEWGPGSGFMHASIIEAVEKMAATFDPSDTGSGYRYRIGPGDVLSITVWERPELTLPTGEARTAEAAGHLVSQTGTMFYPHVGVVQVAGLTVAEVRQILTRGLGRTIQDPQLDVRVAAFRSQKIYVVGEVTTPGLQPITDSPLTVVDAINRAGGASPEADIAGMSLVRAGNVLPIDLLALYEAGDLSQNLLLEDGDLLHVPDRNQHKVFILGEVLNPSSRLMNKGRMTLAEALGDVGGVDPVTSDPSRIYVIRSNSEPPHIYHMNARSPDALILADQFALRPRDVVYVETAELSRWSRIVSQILPAARTLNFMSATDFPLFKGKEGRNATR